MFGAIWCLFGKQEVANWNSLFCLSHDFDSYLIVYFYTPGCQSS